MHKFKISTDIAVIVLSIIGTVSSIVNCFLGSTTDNYLTLTFLWLIILINNIELLIKDMEDE